MPKSLRIFLVEDECMVSMLIEDMIADMGHEIAAVAARIPEAIALARHGAFDLAILDLNLAGEPSYEVATILRNRDISFIFSSGYGKQGVSPDFSGVPMLTKPFTAASLKIALSQFCGP